MILFIDMGVLGGICLLFLLLYHIWRFEKNMSHPFLKSRRSLCMLFCVQVFWVWIFAYSSLVEKKSEETFDDDQNEQWLFLIDVSASMGLKDMNDSHTRLEYAQEIVKSFLPHLKGVPVGVSQFTKEVFSVCPMTFDHLFVRHVIDQMIINDTGIPGTDLQKALITVLKPVQKQRLTVVLFTDGGETFFDLKLPVGIQLFKIGLGQRGDKQIPSSRSIFLNEKLLKALPGTFVLADKKSASSIVKDVMDQRESSLKIQMHKPYSIVGFQWPLFIAMLGVVCLAKAFKDNHE